MTSLKNRPAQSKSRTVSFSYASKIHKPFHLDPPKFSYHDEQRRAPVPKKDEKPIQGLVSDKNYIVANAVENILAGKVHF